MGINAWTSKMSEIAVKMEADLFTNTAEGADALAAGAKMLFPKA